MSRFAITHGCRLACLLLFVSTLLTLAGCGPESGLAPVVGTVTVDATPVESAQVLFMSAGGRPAAAQTDADGRFSLSTYEANDGAMIGEHSVTVTYRPTIPVPPAGEAPPGSVMPKPPPMGWKSPVPEKYSDPSNPLIHLKVEPGENDFDLELISD